MRQRLPCFVAILVCLLTTDSASVSAQAGRVGAFSLPDSPWDIQWQRFKRSVSASGLQLEYFIRGEVGSEEAMLSALKRNRLQVAGITVQGITSVIPELAVAMSPFLFGSAEEVDFVYDNYLLDAVNESLAPHDLILLRWLESGWFSIGSRNKIVLPTDLVDQRIGGSPNVGIQEFLLALGGDAVPIASIDLVQSLDTGLIDGAIKPTALIYSNLRDQVNYVSLLRVAYDTGGLFANRSWFEALPSVYQSALREGHGPSSAVRQEVRDLVQFQVIDMKENGPQVIELSDEQRRMWKRASENVYRRIVDRSGPRAQLMYDTITAAKAAFIRSQGDRP